MAKVYTRQGDSTETIQIDNMDVNYIRGHVNISFFSDSTFDTPVTSGLSGSIDVKTKDAGKNKYVVAENGSINLDLVEAESFFSGPVSSVQVIPSFTGAAYYQVTIIAYDQQDAPVDFLKSFETSERGLTALGVYVQDQTTLPLSLNFTKDLGSISLAADTVVGEYTIEIVTGTSIAAGNIVKLQGASDSRYFFATVLSVAVGTTDTVTIDSPVNKIFTSADDTTFGTDEMLVNGSVTPEVFVIKPTPSQNGDIVRVTVVIEGGDEMDFSSFGSDPKLTRGCILRVKLTDGTFRNLFNFKNNGEFTIESFDTIYQTPKTGNATHGFSSRVTYGGQDNHGVIIRLDGARNEELQLVVQDNLTAANNTSFKATAQGHEVQDGI